MKPAWPNSSRFSRDVGARGVEARDVVPRPLLDERAEQVVADLGRHRPVGGVELGDDPVVAVRLLDGAAAADELAVDLGHEVDRWRPQRQP